MYNIVFFVHITLVWLSSYIFPVTGEIKLSSDGKLNELLFYINDNVPENNGALINNMKVILTEASKALYKATKHMTQGRLPVSLGEVHIRLPESWKLDAEHMTWQHCENSVLRVVTKAMNGNTDNPYTQQLRKCGEPGQFTRFTDSFFQTTGDANIRIKGKQMMREFIRLRYGVFSEEPSKNVLYEFDGNTFIQSTCPASIKWKVNKPAIQCTDKNDLCTYVIEEGQTHNYSIMFDAVTATSEYFCDDHAMPHNRRSPNLHNKKCKRASISSVIRKHSDFQPSQRIGPADYKDPIFRIVKAQTRKIVLVLDTSGSMYPVINATKKALKHFINYTIEDGAEVAIVTFGTSAAIRSKLLPVNTSNRVRLLNIIDGLLVYGETNMGDGLLKGVEALGGNISSPERLFGTIIVLSDGENNEDGEIDYQLAINYIIRKRIITYAIAYGKDSDPDLTRLTTETGGMFIYAPLSSSESQLFSKFTIKKKCDASEKRPVEAMKGSIQIDGSRSMVNFTYIDKFVGNNTSIDVSFPDDISKKKIKLVDPIGFKFSPTGKSKDGKVTTLTFQINGVPVPGMYKLEIKSIRRRRYKRSFENSAISFQVSGVPMGQSYNFEGLLSTTMINTVDERSYVTMTIDLSSVALKEVEYVNVTMTMEYPDNTIHLWTLTDDGWGDDSVEEDGIFTRTIYAKSLKQKGFYQFEGAVSIREFRKGTIRRAVQMESLRVNGISKSATLDRVPPASIHNLKVVSKNLDIRTITIEYMATGDDSMTDNISVYEVRIKSEGVVEFETFSEEKAPYEKVSKELYLDKANMSDVTISIRGIDQAGNSGFWSNWVPA